MGMLLVVTGPPDDVREVCDQILVGLTKDLFLYDSTRSP